MKTDDDEDVFDEREILRDGRSYRPMRFLDSLTQPVHDALPELTDTFGGPVGQRNGHAIPKPGSALARAREVAEAVRITCEALKAEPWRQP